MEQEKVVTIVVHEDSFDVKCSVEMSLDELFDLSVALAQHLEEITDDGSSFYGSTMLQ